MTIHRFVLLHFQLFLFISPYFASEKKTLRPNEYILGHQLQERLHRLSKITEDKTKPGTTRPYLSDAGTAARTLLLEIARESGATTSYIDGVGNVYAEFSCICQNYSHATISANTCNAEGKRQSLLLGSHFDSVASGGKWDGIYGIIAAYSVAQILQPRLCHLPFDIGVVAFDDEEGASPYGVTNFGARAFTSTLNLSRDVKHLEAFIKRFSTVFQNRGIMPTLEHVEAQVQSSAFTNLKEQLVAFIELHIEQGPILQSTKQPVAVVSAIAGQTRMSVSWKGERGHAGTVPMMFRKDALAAAAEGVTIIEQIAKSKENLVATVGKLDVYDSGTNIVSGFTSMSVDVRSEKDYIRSKTVQEIIQQLTQLSLKRSVNVSIEITHNVDAVQMTPWVSDLLDSALISDGNEKIRLMSGAGHDTQYLAQVTDVGMLFVACEGGISHAPDEFVSEEDAYAGALALLNAVEAIAWQKRMETIPVRSSSACGLSQQVDCMHKTHVMNQSLA